MKLMNASALALILAATGVAAESQMSKDATGMAQESGMNSAQMDEMQGNLIRSRDITGGNVYTINEADDEGWDPSYVYEQAGADWNEIGEIEDLVLSRDGKITGIVAEVGGFLDIADKHVVISVDDLNLVAVDDKTYAFVTRLNEEELEAKKGVDEGFWN